MPVRVISREIADISVVDRIPSFHGRPPEKLYRPEPHWEALAAAYKIQETDWHEKVACMLSDPEKVHEECRVGWASSYDILAARQDVIAMPCTIAVVGVVVTSDSRILYGRRGGKVTSQTRKLYGAGMFGAVPAGQMTWRASYEVDPITDTAVAELGEELGFGWEHLESIEPTGFYEVSGELLSGLKCSACLYLAVTAAEVIEKHREALAVSGGPGTRPDEDAIRELRRQGLPVDAWESAEIFTLLNRADQVERLISGDLHEEAIGPLRGAMELYRAHAFKTY